MNECIHTNESVYIYTHIYIFNTFVAIVAELQNFNDKSNIKYKRRKNFHHTVFSLCCPLSFRFWKCLNDGVNQPMGSTIASTSL